LFAIHAIIKNKSSQNETNLRQSVQISAIGVDSNKSIRSLYFAVAKRLQIFERNLDMLKSLANESALVAEELTDAAIIELTDGEVELVAGGAAGKEQIA
jgi:hypothetical protein